MIVDFISITGTSIVALNTRLYRAAVLGIFGILVNMIPHNLLIAILSVTILMGCSATKEDQLENSCIEVQLPKLSKFPLNDIFVDTSDQMESRTYPFNLSLSENEIVSFSDSIDYHQFEWQYDITSLSRQDSSITGLLELTVDTTQLFSWKYWERYYIEPTTITEDGREIPPKPYIPPYENVVKLPVFIRNHNDSIEAVEVHDGRFVVIQEALTETNEWKPIEFFAFSGCGNSYGIRKIEPGEFMLFTINKYQGDFKTKLRLKMRSNGAIFISNEFTGSIHKSQFKEDEVSSFIWKTYLDNED